MDYLVFGRNIYIKNNDRKFVSYDYYNNIVDEFNFVVEGNKIIFDSLNNHVESIGLMSEILYFMGNKCKDVIFKNSFNLDLSSIGFCNIDGECVKSVLAFDGERKKKFRTIDELYGYPELVPWNLVEREHDVIDLVCEYVDVDSKILEIGSGYGKNLLLLEDKGYKDVIGVEYSRRAFELSKRIVSNNYYGDITNTDFDDGQFDVIVDIGCLHCVEEGDSAIREVYRILKSNGMIISRYFLPKDKKWLDRFPVAVSSFGSKYDDLLNSFKDFNIIKSFIENECIYVIGVKK